MFLKGCFGQTLFDAYHCFCLQWTHVAVCYVYGAEAQGIEHVSWGNRSHCKLSATARAQHRARWRSGRPITWKFNSSESLEGNHSNHRNPKHWPGSGWHEKPCLQSQTCCHLHARGSGASIWTSSQREQTCNVPVAQSLAVIFANGSSLGDLRSRDTGQLEKGKHKSPGLSRERFTISQSSFF